MKTLAIGLSALAAAAGCDNSQAWREPEGGLQRMQQQPRADPYEASPFFPDGRWMQPPPPGAIPRERAFAGAPAIESGVSGADYLARIPLEVTPALVALGRDRFDLHCAACHGVLGDGDSVVAQKMTLRKPPSLHEPRIAALPPGQVFQVISAGYGLMASYAVELSIEERWGVVAYVQALELARSARPDELPTEVRQRLEEQAP